MTSPAPSLPQDLSERLRRAGRIPAAPRGALQRVRLRLEATLRWNVPVAEGFSSPRVGGLPLAHSGAGWLLGVGALVVGATMSGVLMRHPVRRSTAAPAPTPPAASEPVPSPQPPPGAPAPVELRPLTPKVQPARPAPPPTHPGSSSLEARRASDDRLAAESQVLGLARAALTEGDVYLSLAMLEQHRRNFPEGQLLPQREALRIEALIASEDYPAALAAANAFRHRFPESLLKLKIDRFIRDLPDEWQQE